MPIALLLFCVLTLALVPFVSSLNPSDEYARYRFDMGTVGDANKTLTVSILANSTDMEITMTGPSTRWFGISFASDYSVVFDSTTTNSFMINSTYARLEPTSGAEISNTPAGNTRTVVWRQPASIPGIFTFNPQLLQGCRSFITVRGLISTAAQALGADPTNSMTQSKDFSFYSAQYMIRHIGHAFAPGDFACKGQGATPQCTPQASSNVPKTPEETPTSVFTLNLTFDGSHSKGTVGLRWNVDPTTYISILQMRSSTVTGIGFPRDPANRNANALHKMYAITYEPVRGANDVKDGSVLDATGCIAATPPTECANSITNIGSWIAEPTTPAPACYTKNAGTLVVNSRSSSSSHRTVDVTRDAFTADNMTQYQFDMHVITRCDQPFTVVAYMVTAFQVVCQTCGNSNPSVNPVLGHWVAIQDFVLFNSKAPSLSPTLLPTDSPSSAPSDVPSAPPTSAPTFFCPTPALNDTTLTFNSRVGLAHMGCGGPLETAGHPGGAFAGIDFTCTQATTTRQNAALDKMGYNLTLYRLTDTVKINFWGPVGRFFAIGFPYGRDQKVQAVGSGFHDAYVLAYTTLRTDNTSLANVYTFRMGTANATAFEYASTPCNNGICPYMATTAPVTVDSIQTIGSTVFVSVSRPLGATLADDYAFSLDPFLGCGESMYITYALGALPQIPMWEIQGVISTSRSIFHLYKVDIHVAFPTAVPTDAPSAPPTIAPSRTPTGTPTTGVPTTAPSPAPTRPWLRYGFGPSILLLANRQVSITTFTEPEFTNTTLITLVGPADVDWAIALTNGFFQLNFPNNQSHGPAYVLKYNSQTKQMCEGTMTSTQVAGIVYSVDPFSCVSAPYSWGTSESAAVVNNEVTITLVRPPSIRVGTWDFMPASIFSGLLQVCGVSARIGSPTDLTHGAGVNWAGCTFVTTWTTNFGFFIRPKPLPLPAITTLPGSSFTFAIRINRFQTIPTLTVIGTAPPELFWCVGYWDYTRTFDAGLVVTDIETLWYACKDQFGMYLGQWGGNNANSFWWVSGTTACGPNAPDSQLTSICGNYQSTTMGGMVQTSADFKLQLNSRFYTPFPITVLMEQRTMPVSYFVARQNSPTMTLRGSLESDFPNVETGIITIALAYRTEAPTFAPTTVPSNAPTTVPSAVPSHSPSSTPSLAPSSVPSGMPTGVPSLAPSAVPTVSPVTSTPTTSPSQSPTSSPTVSSFFHQEVNVTGRAGSTNTGCLTTAYSISSALYLRAVEAMGIDTTGLVSMVSNCVDRRTTATPARRRAQALDTSINTVTHTIVISSNGEHFRWQLLRAINYNLTGFRDVLATFLIEAPLVQQVLAVGPATADPIYIHPLCRDLPYPRICRYPVRWVTTQSGVTRDERQFISFAFDQPADEVIFRFEKPSNGRWYAYSFTNSSQTGKVIVGDSTGVRVLDVSAQVSLAGLSATPVVNLNSSLVLFANVYATNIRVPAMTVGVDTQWKIIPLLRYEFGVDSTYGSAAVTSGALSNLLMTPSLADSLIVPPAATCSSTGTQFLGFTTRVLENTTALGSPITMALEYLCVLDRVIVTLTGPELKWFGVLFGKQMAASPAIIYTAGKSDTETLQLYDYYLVDNTINGVQKDASQDWQRINVTNANGIVTVSYSRPFVTGDSRDYAFSAADTNLNVMWAMGSATQLAYHGPDGHAKAPINVVLSAGSGASTAGSKTRNPVLLNAHAIFVCLGLFIFIPSGILVMRNKIMIQRDAADERFLMLHRGINVGGVVLLLIGVLLGFLNATDFGTPQFSEVHHVVGVLLAVMAIAIPISGQCRPHFTPGEYKETKRTVWEWAHKISGYLLVLFGLGQAYGGLLLAGYDQFTVFILFAAIVLILAWLIFECVRRSLFHDYEGLPEGKQMVEDDDFVEMGTTRGGSGGRTLDFGGKSQTNVVASQSPKRDVNYVE